MPNITGLLATVRQGIVYPPINGTATLTLSGYSAEIRTGTSINVVLDENYTLAAWGYKVWGTFGVDVTLSGYSATILCGGTAIGTIPLPTLSTSGTVTALATAELAVSGYTLDCTGTTDIQGQANVALNGAFSHTILGGGRATLTGPSISHTASATTDGLGQVRLTAPSFRLTSTGSTDNHGQVIGILPTLKVGSSGVVIGTLPRATISISGGQISVTYEAFSFTFMEDKDGERAVLATHYTTFPFDRIVRFGNTHYGVAADGLYELGGDTFDGAPIVANVQTAPTDFKSRELKRPFSLYMSGRLGADFRVSVVGAEVDTQTHSYRPVDKTGARNYRSLFGRGMRARYLAYAFTNTDGGDFELDDITPEVVVLRRTA